MKKEHIVHAIEPVFDKNSQILILGSMPSPKSREAGFYYGHPQNLFWPALAAVLAKPEPDKNKAARKAFALQNKVALWDVLASCDIQGADDSSITNVEPNEIKRILDYAPVKAVFTTGKQAKKLYDKYCWPQTHQAAIYLPSTSPANRAMQKKPEFWQAWFQLRTYL